MAKKKTAKKKDIPFPLDPLPTELVSDGEVKVAGTTDDVDPLDPSIPQSITLISIPDGVISTDDTNARDLNAMEDLSSQIDGLYAQLEKDLLTIRDEVEQAMMCKRFAARIPGLTFCGFDPKLGTPVFLAA